MIPDQITRESSPHREYLGNAIGNASRSVRSHAELRKQRLIAIETVVLNGQNDGFESSAGRCPEPLVLRDEARESW